MRARILVVLSAFVLLCSPAASAQSANQSHWGVAVNFGPSAAVPADTMGKVVLLGDPKNVKVSSVEVGFVRGRDRGGDWGAEVTYRRVADGSEAGKVREFCVFPGQPCELWGTRYALSGATLLGFTVHKYVPFVTIAGRAQVGLTIAGGVASIRGQIEKHELAAVPTKQGGTGSAVQTDTVSSVPAAEAFRASTLPIGKVELTGAALLAPGLKLRVGWGLNFPSYPSFTVGVTYLIGAR